MGSFASLGLLFHHPQMFSESLPVWKLTIKFRGEIQMGSEFKGISQMKKSFSKNTCSGRRVFICGPETDCHIFSAMWHTWACTSQISLNKSCTPQHFLTEEPRVVLHPWFQPWTTPTNRFLMDSRARVLMISLNPLFGQNWMKLTSV